MSTRHVHPNDTLRLNTNNFSSRNVTFITGIQFRLLYFTMSADQANFRKLRGRSFGDDDVEFDHHVAKKVKDSELSDTSSEGTDEDNKLQRMAEAIKTVLEVR